MTVVRADDRAALASPGHYFQQLRREFPYAGDRVLALQSRRLAALGALDRFHGRGTIFAALALQEWLTRGYLDTAEQLRRRD